MVNNFTKAMRRVLGARMRKICHNRANSGD